MYGPYWPGIEAEISGCQIDVCNGFFYKNPDKSSTVKYLYGYATTLYHPYGPACFGPANYIGFSQRPQLCSDNPKQCFGVHLENLTLVTVTVALLFNLF